MGIGGCIVLIAVGAISHLRYRLAPEGCQPRPGRAHLHGGRHHRNRHLRQHRPPAAVRDPARRDHRRGTGRPRPALLSTDRPSGAGGLRRRDPRLCQCLGLVDDRPRDRDLPAALSGRAPDGRRRVSAGGRDGAASRAWRRHPTASRPCRPAPGEPGRAVRGDPDRDAPVLLVDVAGRVLVRRVVVAGRGHRRDVQDALRAPPGRAPGPGRGRCPRPAPSASSSGGVAETSSRVDGPVAGVELLAGRRR